MDADYSVELGPTADALELPWKDPDGRLHYVNLRGDLLERDVELIPEAQQFPALRRFLVELNSQPSPWQTAKCDVWAETVEPEENIFGASFAQGCYVDIVLTRDAASLRDGLKDHQRLARKAALQLDDDEELEATVEIVVRRCYFHRGDEEESDAGYCLTLFLTGYGASPLEAVDHWERALEMVGICLLQLQPHEGRAKA
jgi:hypothetical protein